MTKLHFDNHATDNKRLIRLWSGSQSSLEKALLASSLRRQGPKLRRCYAMSHVQRLIIDEVSMLGREMFEILVDACADEDMGLILVGDFLQLAAIPDNKGWDRQTEWLFESKAWAKFNVCTKHDHLRLC